MAQTITTNSTIDAGTELIIVNGDRLFTQTDDEFLFFEFLDGIWYIDDGVIQNLETDETLDVTQENIDAALENGRLTPLKPIN